MGRTTPVTGDELTNALRALGGQNQDSFLHKQPARLIAALAKSEESRLRLSLISLFLEHPEFSIHVRDIAHDLDPPAQLTLQCYYSAAVWLAQEYHQQISLPDYFSKQLQLHPTSDPDENLRTLAKRHRELSGAGVNWLGTYQHAVQVWQKGSEYKRV